MLLAETTPAGPTTCAAGDASTSAGGHPERLSSAEVWRSWFAPYFRFIRANDDVVAGFHYIAANWRADPLWTNTPPFIGGDARIWKDREVLRRWTATLRHRRYLAGDRRLWSQLA